MTTGTPQRVRNDAGNLEGGDGEAANSRPASLLDQAWRAWDVGDAEGVLALIAQARTLTDVAPDALSWMDEAETAAREQADNARYQRTRALLRDGDLATGLRTWLDLSASARAAIRLDFDLDEFRWLDELNAGRIDAVLALGRARMVLGDEDRARASGAMAPLRSCSLPSSWSNA